MTPLQFVHVLQLSDSFFPVGAFAYSDGLETAATQGAVCDAAALKSWMDHFLENIFIPCDGLAVWKCAEAMRIGDYPAVFALDMELTAIKPSEAVRNASRLIGKRLLNTYCSGMTADRDFAQFAESLPQGNAPVAYAAVLHHRGIRSHDAVLSFGYSRLAGIVSAGLRLISMGQQQAQNLLSETLERLPDAADQIVRMEAEPLRSFAPLMDIAQMNHRYLYSRLFRS